MNETILIADDEPLARRTLRSQLREIGCRGTIHEAPDGQAAIALANEVRPDLIFLDIVMPGATGLQVLEQLDYEPKVIFTTAHDQYAITAFELGALDYVLKPFGRERLERVFKRARSVSSARTDPLLDRAKEALQPARRPLSRIFVRDGNRIVPIGLASIERVQGADDYATIVTLTKEYLVSIRLSDLESQLAHESFLRIHRSHLINLEYVTSIQPWDAGRLQVVMKSGAQIGASRAGSKRLRDLTYERR
jgi:two-component system, LytTR family, response regulator